MFLNDHEAIKRLQVNLETRKCKTFSYTLKQIKAVLDGESVTGLNCSSTLVGIYFKELICWMNIVAQELGLDYACTINANTRPRREFCSFASLVNNRYGTNFCTDESCSAVDTIEQIMDFLGGRVR